MQQRHKDRYYNKTIADGQSNIKRHDCYSADPLYIAPSYKNGAEHPRWINRNWEDIDATLKKCVNGNAYEIRLPEKDRAQGMLQHAMSILYFSRAFC